MGEIQPAPSGPAKRQPDERALVVRGPAPPLELRVSSEFATEMLHGAVAEALAGAQVVRRPLTRFAGLRSTEVSFGDGRAGVRLDLDLHRVIQFFQRSVIDVEILHLRLTDPSTISFEVGKPLGLGAVPRILSLWKLPKPLANLVRQLTTPGATVSLRLPELARTSHSFLVRHMLKRYQLAELRCVEDELRLSAAKITP
ncbi:hypothetical protein Poly30_43080 [Planctomycetes bacterium Poly30]|uniref:Uncharacterized protein n=1 Tax=Saltatorellus ferox TaxID=2528018 RepID=A0A518EXE7_9BACT|nr:hypothetical protein Poly30_43080 [Planctomycetes bacterium Poly30]